MGSTAMSNMCQAPAEGEDTLSLGPDYALIGAEISTLRKTVVNRYLEKHSSRLDRYLDDLTFTTPHMKICMDAFIDELQRGLLLHRKDHNSWHKDECSFKMLDSCVPKLPTGKESGVCYALDFGGSNFRVCRIALDKGRVARTDQLRESLSNCDGDVKALPKGLLDPLASATDMFGFFARTVRTLMLKCGDCDEGGNCLYVDNNGDKQSRMSCGFTFSYPCTQRAIDSAELIVWTKGFETGRATDDKVEGLDVVRLMNRALVKEGVPVQITTVLNDTVGTQLSCAYSLDLAKNPPCTVGLILGTGFNACYQDPTAMTDYGYNGSIINIECGNFNRCLPQIAVDFELDFADVAGRGTQHAEKIVAGAYIGEICRRTFVKVFQFKAPESAWKPYSFSSEDAAKIVQDSTDNLAVCRKVIGEKWRGVDVDSLEANDLKAVQAICRAVFERSARLSAVIIAACAKKTGKLSAAMNGVSVGIDGSLYKMNKFYQDMVSTGLVDLLGANTAKLIRLHFAEDGSGRGAAILAASVH